MNTNWDNLIRSIGKQSAVNQQNTSQMVAGAMAKQGLLHSSNYAKVLGEALAKVKANEDVQVGQIQVQALAKKQEEARYEEEKKRKELQMWLSLLTPIVENVSRPLGALMFKPKEDVEK